MSLQLHENRDRPVTLQPVILRLTEVERFLGLGRTAIYNLREKDPTFPRPVQLTDKAIGWRRKDLESWVNGLPHVGPHTAKARNARVGEAQHALGR